MKKMKHETLQISYNRQFIFYVIAILTVFLYLLMTPPVLANESIKIGIYDNKPLLFKENDEIQGFLVDILDYIASEEKWEIEYVYDTWENNLNKLKNNDIDMLIGIAYSQERDKLFDFNNETFITNWAQIYSQKNLDIQSILDLEGKQVAVLKGDIFYTGDGGIKGLLSKFNIDVDYVEVNSYEEVFQSIRDKNVDLGLVNRIYGTLYENNYNVKKTPIVFKPVEVRAAVSSGQGKELLDKIDENLKALKKDKTSFYYQKLDFWLSKSLGFNHQAFLWYILKIFGVLLLISFIVILITRHQVITKKNELKLSYQQLEKKNEELININEELEATYQQVDALNNNLEKTIELTGSLSKTSFDNEKIFLSNLLHTALKLIPEADYGSVYTYQDNNIKFIDAIGHDLEILKKLSIKLEAFYHDDKVSIKHNILQHTASKMDINTVDKFMKACMPVKETLTFDLYIDNDKIAGISLDIAKESNKNFSDDAKKVMNSFKNLASAFFTVKRYREAQEEFQRDIIVSIIQLLEIHDKYTKDHSQNVALLAREIAKEMELSREEIEKAYWAGMLHDIGKILIPESILNKEGPLTKDEYQQIKNHPYWGYMTLSKSKLLTDISEYVLQHHEHWDGSGYPKNLKGDEIHLISQILAVADTWDAMRSDRSYRKALTKEIAIKEIVDKKGEQFSPKVVDVFLRVIDNQV
ncbi:hypothetical protein BHF71_06810 [Vulcanibacillus modesticaldus]|uniref:Uncharacterized protein n=1 Tax=Vulcanibacillus modesticaldus TaxID=337097 RepID=A0A1D2YW65_9BACI|nr:HD domain-containing phosphohydrolase [Vulcanibacillus modesticaldus]OEF99980.1 hypothetical protein BHF71_06810 [Vulcanibacillus modesticaldus]